MVNFPLPDNFSGNTLCDSLLMEFRKNLVRLGIKKGDKLLVGFSGGPDSTLLLYFTSLLRTELDLKLYAVYIDHGIRGVVEIEKEIGFVKDFYRRFGVAGFVERIPHGEIERMATEEGRSVEEVAREKRYEIFYRYVSELNITHILLGHNMDDNVETVLMRFLYGSGLKGLAGIPEINGMVKRPLFTFSKEDILSCLREEKLRFSVDSTNAQDDYFRNIVRNQILPRIERYVPDVRRRVVSLSERARLLKDFLDWNFEQAINNGYIKRIKDGYKINGTWFVSLHPLLRVEICYSMLNFYGRLKYSTSGKGFTQGDTLPHRFFTPLLDMKKFRGRRIILNGYGIRLEWIGEHLFWTRNIVDNAKKGYLIKLRNSSLYSYSIELLSKRIGIEKIKIEEIRSTVENEGKPIGIEINKEKSNVVVINGCFKPPLFIRSRRDGDRIKTSRGEKSLKKIFLDMGVRGKDRENIPLLCDREGVAVVMGGALGYDYRFRENFEMTRKGSLFKIKLNLMEKD